MREGHVLVVPKSSTASRPPAPPPPAMRVALSRLPVIFQTIARRTRPPSSGKPGIMLKSPTTTFTGPSQTSSVSSGPSCATSISADVDVGRSQVDEERARDAAWRGRARCSRSDRRSRSGAPRCGVGRLLLDVRDASEEMERDVADRDPVARARPPSARARGRGSTRRT